MDPERWRRLEALLDQALDATGEQREAILHRAHAEDPALADEVRGILARGERTGSVLDTPAPHVGAVLLATDAALHFPAPERAGPWRIERLIGEGGMGAVYLARRDDGVFDQQVALKVVRSGLHLDARVLRRFREERQILAGLSHPGIVPLLDGGITEAGLPYFAMEHVAGLPVTRFCEARGLGIPERLELFARVCDAVAHAHGKLIVHRDIKPSNILVTESGDPRLLDFGIAKLLDATPGSAVETQRSERLLTPEYASPEQIRGEPVTMASDVYALGVLLYELLTGRRPFVRAGRTAHELERAVLEDEPTRPSHAVQRDPRQRQLRGDLDAIVLTAMSKDASRRYPSAAELGADVRHHLRGEPVTARPASRAYRLRRWARRHRLGLSTAAAAVVGAGLIQVLTRELDRAPGDRVLQAMRLAEPLHLTNDEGLELDPALSPDGARVAYAAGLGDTTRIFVRQADGSRPLLVSGDIPGVLRRPRWSPDGSRLLFMGGGGIWQVASTGGPAREVVAPPANDSGGIAHSPAWSPDGRSLAWVRSDTLFVRAIEGDGPRALAHVEVAHSLAWSPDGRWIAVVSGNHEFAYNQLGNLGPSALFLVPADCDARRSCEPLPLIAPTSLNTSPAWLDPSRLLFISTRGGARDLFAVRIGARGGHDEPVRLSAGQDLHSVSAAADGRTLAYAVFRQRSNIWSLDVSGSAPRRLSEAVPITSGQQAVEGVALSPDGQWLAYDANLAGQQDIFVIPASGGEPERVVATPGDEFHPSWSPDGGTLAFYTFREGVRRAATVPARGGPVRLVHPDGPVREQHSPVWTPDGLGLVYWRNFEYGTQLFEVRRADDSTWSAERQVTRRGGVAPSFSADGRRATYIGVWPGGVILTGPELDESSGRLVFAPPSPGSDGVLVDAQVVSRDGRSFIAKGRDRAGAAFWRVPLDGGTPSLLVRLDDPRRTVSRHEFATDGRRLFFILTEREADLWTVRLEGR